MAYGDIQQLLHYQIAAELDPDNAAPHSNLSAAYFELGEYSLAASACDAAAKRLIDEEDNAQLKQRLASRKMKACIHALHFSGAIEAVSSLPKTRELQQLEQCMKRYQRNIESVGDSEVAHKKLISELPRYKPSM